MSNSHQSFEAQKVDLTAAHLIQPGCKIFSSVHFIGFQPCINTQNVGKKSRLEAEEGASGHI